MPGVRVNPPRSEIFGSADDWCASMPAERIWASVRQDIVEEQQISGTGALDYAELIETGIAAFKIVIEPNDRGDDARIFHSGAAVAVRTKFLAVAIAQDLQRLAAFDPRLGGASYSKIDRPYEWQF